MANQQAGKHYHSKEICTQEAEALAVLLKKAPCRWDVNEIYPTAEEKGTCRGGSLICQDARDPLPEFKVRYTSGQLSCPKTEKTCGEVSDECRDSMLLLEKNACDGVLYDDPHRYPRDLPAVDTTKVRR